MTEVILELQGGVAVITLGEPGMRNALTGALAEELIEMYDRLPIGLRPRTTR